MASIEVVMEGFLFEQCVRKGEATMVLELIGDELQLISMAGRAPFEVDSFNRRAVRFYCTERRKKTSRGGQAGRLGEGVVLLFGWWF